MKKGVVITVTLLAVLAAGIVLMYAEDKTPPKEIVFEAKNGNVTFNHAKHLEAAKNDCKVCHPGLFPESKAPIAFKEGMHKKAEAGKTSCAGCHVAGGTSFEVKGNCTKCHVKK